MSDEITYTDLAHLVLREGSLMNARSFMINKENRLRNEGLHGMADDCARWIDAIHIELRRLNHARPTFAEILYDKTKQESYRRKEERAEHNNKIFPVQTFKEVMDKDYILNAPTVELCQDENGVYSISYGGKKEMRKPPDEEEMIHIYASGYATAMTEFLFLYDHLNAPKYPSHTKEHKEWWTGAAEGCAFQVAFKGEDEEKVCEYILDAHKEAYTRFYEHYQSHMKAKEIAKAKLGARQ